MQTELLATVEIVPAGQELQADAPEGEYEPAGQIIYDAVEDPTSALK